MKHFLEEVSVDSSRFWKDRAVSVGPRLGARRLLSLTRVKGREWELRVPRFWWIFYPLLWVGISGHRHGKQMSGAVGRWVWGAGLWVYLATASFPVNLWPFTHVFCRGGGEIKSCKTKFSAYSNVNTGKQIFCMQKALKVPSFSNCSVQLFFFFLESFHFDSGGCTKQKCWYHFFSVPVVVQITFSPEVTIELGFGLNACP